MTYDHTDAARSPMLSADKFNWAATCHLGYGHRTTIEADACRRDYLRGHELLGYRYQHYCPIEGLVQ